MFVFSLSVLIAAGIGCLVWGLVILGDGRSYLGWPLFVAGVLSLLGCYLLYLRNGRKRLNRPPQP